jgi:hypothetical protein
VLLISPPQSIKSLKFLSLPHIIRGYLCGVDTQIVKIRCPGAEIKAKKPFTNTEIYFATLYINFHKILGKRKKTFNILLFKNILIFSHILFTLYTNFKPVTTTSFSQNPWKKKENIQHFILARLIFSHILSI